MKEKIIALEIAVKSRRLFHVHLGEEHRGIYGTGEVSKMNLQMVKCLRDHKYVGAAVLELFCPELYEVVGIKEDLGKPEDVAARSLDYLAKHMPD